MSTYVEKLDYTEETKNLIKDAIVKKGVAVAPEDTFRSYADKINKIPTGVADNGVFTCIMHTPEELTSRPRWRFLDGFKGFDFSKIKKDYMDEFFNGYPFDTIDAATLDLTNTSCANNLFYNLKVINYENLKFNKPISFYYAFHSTKNEILDLSNWDFSKVTDIEGIFCGGTNLTNIIFNKNMNINNGKITSLRSVFKDCRKLDHYPEGVLNWDTSNITNMSYLFKSVGYDYKNVSGKQDSIPEGLRLLDVSNLDTSKVTDMSYMFSAMTFSVLKTVRDDGTTKWNTSNVTNMSHMFEHSDRFRLISGMENWDTSKVTDMSYMFNLCEYWVDTPDLNMENWNTESLINCENMFGYIYASGIENIIWPHNFLPNPKITYFKLAALESITHETVLDLFNKLATRTNTPTVRLSSKSYDLMTPEEIKIAQDKGWTITK